MADIIEPRRRSISDGCLRHGNCSSNNLAWIGAVLLFLLVGLVIDVPLAFVTGYARQLMDIVGAFQGHAPPPPENPLANYGKNLLFGIGSTVVNSILMGGLYRMAVRQGRGETINATYVFSALDRSPALIVLTLITQFLTVIGTYICILPGFIVAGLLMFAPLFVVDRRLGPIQAISESFNLLKSQWLMAAGFYFVAALLGGVGALLCGVGLVATYPIWFGSVALGYLAFTQPTQEQPFPGYGAPQPGVWPPPPGSPSPPPYGGPPSGF
jgi:hypothetical protein